MTLLIAIVPELPKERRLTTQIQPEGQEEIGLWR
jgi:hypothetical protein